MLVLISSEHSVGMFATLVHVYRTSVPYRKPLVHVDVQHMDTTRGEENMPTHKSHALLGYTWHELDGGENKTLTLTKYCSCAHKEFHKTVSPLIDGIAVKRKPFANIKRGEGNGSSRGRN